MDNMELTSGTLRSMDHSLAVAGLVLANANLLLHATGLYLLHILRKRTLKGSQTTLIMHLSLSEAFLSIAQGTKHIATICRRSEGDRWAITYDYATVVEYTGFAIVYYFDMIYITLYRCAKILLGVNYSQYWSDRKTNYLCTVTWIAAIGLCFAIGILKYLYQIDYATFFFKFVYPPTEAVFLILAIITYTAIFRKYRKSMLRFHRNTYSLYRQQHSQLKKKITAKFYIPTLLIITFILFMVVPDMIVLSYFIILQRQSKVLETVITIMYTLSVTSDGVIYIFFQGVVRRLLFKKLHIFKDRSDSTATQSHAFYVNLQGSSPLPARANEKMTNLLHVSTIQAANENRKEQDDRQSPYPQGVTKDEVPPINSSQVVLIISNMRALDDVKSSDKRMQALNPSINVVAENTQGPKGNQILSQHNILIAIEGSCRHDASSITSTASSTNTKGSYVLVIRENKNHVDQTTRL